MCMYEGFVVCKSVVVRVWEYDITCETKYDYSLKGLSYKTVKKAPINWWVFESYCEVGKKNPRKTLRVEGWPGTI